jgi:predicted nucleic acid-binding protein
LGGLKLADTSAWHRARHPAVAGAWRPALLRGEVATTEIVRLEVLYSARNAMDYDSIATTLDALVQLPSRRAAVLRALDVQRLLAHRGGLHHRIPTPDLVIAAVAELHEATVWHYDADYDRIAEVTGQPMEWVAPKGSL